MTFVFLNVNLFIKRSREWYTRDMGSYCVITAPWLLLAHLGFPEALPLRRSNPLVIADERKGFAVFPHDLKSCPLWLLVD